MTGRSATPHLFPCPRCYRLALPRVIPPLNVESRLVDSVHSPELLADLLKVPLLRIGLVVLGLL